MWHIAGSDTANDCMRALSQTTKPIPAHRHTATVLKAGAVTSQLSRLAAVTSVLALPLGSEQTASAANGHPT